MKSFYPVFFTILLFLNTNDCWCQCYLVGMEKNGQQVTLPRNKILKVELDANFSTGSSWQIEKIDNKMLTVVDSCKDYKSPPNLAGAPGKQTLCFIGAAKGITELELVYRRSWEKDKEPSKRFKIIVKCQGAYKIKKRK